MAGLPTIDELTRGADVGSLIPAIVRATGLPLNHLRAIQSQPLGWTRRARLWEGSGEQGGSEDFIPVPTLLVEELRKTPYSNLLGQAVFIEDQMRQTSMVSIAEAAFIQLNGLYELLECLLFLIDDAIRTNSTSAQWTLVWFLDKSNATRAVSQLGLQNASVRKQHQTRLPTTGLLGVKIPEEYSHRAQEPAKHEKETEAEICTQEADRDDLGQQVEEQMLEWNFFNDTPIRIRLTYDDWAVVMPCSRSGQSHAASIDVKAVLRWISTALGATVNENSKLFDITKLFDISRDSYFKINAKDAIPSYHLCTWDFNTNPEQGIRSCWRSKVLEGIVLKAGFSTLPNVRQSYELPFRQSYELPFPPVSFGLMLTAAALWSLFDNSLQRVPGCRCTFRSEGGDYLRCEQKQGNWFLWHCIPALVEDKMCDGSSCEQHLPVALNDKETGERLVTTTPCVLGWTVETRSHAARPIATTLAVTSALSKRKITKKFIASYQFQAALGAPFPVSPQILGGMTFSKKRYIVANSIDLDSDIATNMAAATTVLVYCEKRGIHLLITGADLIEIICMHLLQQTNYNSSMDFFTYGTAETRLRSWTDSMFQMPHLEAIAGSKLVRQASKLISSLYDTTKNVSRDHKGHSVYWTLEGLLQLSEQEPVLMSGHRIHVGWHMLAAKSPPLILAVGEIDHGLITANCGSLNSGGYGKMLEAIEKHSEKPHLLTRLTKYPKKEVLGGLVANRKMLQNWLRHTANGLGEGEGMYLIIHGESKSELVKALDLLSNPTVFAKCSTCNLPFQHIQCVHYVE